MHYSIKTFRYNKKIAPSTRCCSILLTSSQNLHKVCAIHWIPILWIVVAEQLLLKPPMGYGALPFKGVSGNGYASRVWKGEKENLGIYLSCLQ